MAHARSREVVFLIGPRGSGKTTVAALLAERLGWTWTDADVILEQQAGRSIKEVFATEGESGFRARERQVLQELCELERTVIATGGGAVLLEENRERIRQAGPVVWLTADVETLWQRIRRDAGTAERRPALGVGGREEVQQILAAREPLYQDAAHFQVDTRGRTPDQVAAAVLALLAGCGERTGGG